MTQDNTPTDLKVIHIPSRDERLGRQIVHDPQSRRFALPQPAINKDAWKTKTLRIIDPRPNPNQVIGDCTGCNKAMMLNQQGNRFPGRVLTLKDADAIYSLATTLDPFPGNYPPTDTGSSGLAAAKAAQQMGLGGEYLWLFNGADGVVQAVQDGHVVGVGTKWYDGMFQIGSNGFIEPTGQVAGGHQWTIRGYVKSQDALIGRCWWGAFRDFKIKREHLNQLLQDDGDAHIQKRAGL